MVTQMVCTTLLVMVACVSLAHSASYAEAFAGIAFPHGSEEVTVSGGKMTVGSFGTQISLSGLIEIAGPVSIAPNATFVSTSARSAATPTSTGHELEYRQNDIGLDCMFSLPELERIRIGAGAAFAWWNAALKYKVNYTSYSDPAGREFGADHDWLVRAIGHWTLRDPASAGFVLKAVVAIPLSKLGGSGSGFASGYAGLGIGFSLPLDR